MSRLLFDGRTWVVALGMFGLLHPLVLRWLVCIFPKSHPRRAELIAELYIRPLHGRLFYVVQCLEVSIAEGLPARHRLRVKRRRQAVLRGSTQRIPRESAGPHRNVIDFPTIRVYELTGP